MSNQSDIEKAITLLESNGYEVVNNDLYVGLELRCINKDDTYTVGTYMKVTTVNNKLGNVVFNNGVHMPIGLLESKIKSNIYQKLINGVPQKLNEIFNVNRLERKKAQIHLVYFIMESNCSDKEKLELINSIETLYKI